MNQIYPLQDLLFYHPSCRVFGSWGYLESGVVVLAIIPIQVVFSTGSEKYKKVILNISSDNVQENILATH